MKYVYKKNENPDDNKKTKGHAKNNLIRKKRSVIVDYETSHTPYTENKHDQIIYPPENAQKYIKPSDLADFNIETLHDDIRKANLDLNNAPIQVSYPRPILNVENTQKVSPNSAENHSGTSEEIQTEDTVRDIISDDDSGQFGRSKLSYRSEEEHEIIPEAQKNSGSEENDLNETATDSSSDLSKEIDQDKPDNEKYAHTKIHDEQSNEKYSSTEKADKYKKTQESGQESEQESDEKEDLKSNDAMENLEANDDYKENHSSQSSESIETNKETDAHSEITLHDGSQESEANHKIKSPLNIQDVDLRDFSYERIQLNEKGDIESARDHLDNDEDSDFNKYPKVNEGEVKPVIEISNESAELSEENEDDVHQRANINNLDKSLNPHLESSKEEFSNEKIGNIENRYSEVKKLQNNAKQEFERIPLNYKHDKNSHEDTPTSRINDENETPTKTSSSDQNENAHDDALPPEDTHYDKHLNIKFDDVSIKLPEIKLPEDVLAYNYEESPPKPKNKINTLHSEEDSEEEENNNEKKTNNKNEDGDDIDYKSYDGNYYGKTKPVYDYKRAPHDDEEDDHDVDLYEKFVRERFGKRGSFEKRLENIERYVPTNTQLSETIGKLLKRTEETTKEAAKTKDPKADYMWTLEYGEQL